MFDNALLRFVKSLDDSVIKPLHHQQPELRAERYVSS
ncbi:Uncharacterised protein [Segatella copri]|nr:Uncharacterised protein [Segatella copri]